MSGPSWASVRKSWGAEATSSTTRQSSLSTRLEYKKVRLPHSPYFFSYHHNIIFHPTA